MPVTDITHDLDDLTITITAQFAAPVERIWHIYADPRQLERAWGPEEYPATVVDHSLTPGGTVTYCMTGPEGPPLRVLDRSRGRRTALVLLQGRIRPRGLHPGLLAARLSLRQHVHRARGRHPRRLRHDLRQPRGPADGPGDGRRGGLPLRDRPDRRPARLTPSADRPAPPEGRPLRGADCPSAAGGSPGGVRACAQPPRREVATP